MLNLSTDTEVPNGSNLAVLHGVEVKMGRKSTFRQQQLRFSFDAAVRELLKESKDISIHFEHLQERLDAARTLDDGSIFKSKVHDSRHVSRVAFLVKAVSSIYIWIYKHFPFEGDVLSLEKYFTEHIFYIQLAALFHDAGRQGDGDDTIEWERESASYFYFYLTEALGILPDQASEYAEFILNKDVRIGDNSKYQKICFDDGEIIFTESLFSGRKPMGWVILQTADCIDIIRARKSFDFRFLDFYGILLKHKRVVEAHLLVNGLIRETTAIISITGNDRFLSENDNAELENMFYSDPKRAYSNLVSMVLDPLSKLYGCCEEIGVSFRYLPLLFNIADGVCGTGNLDAYFSADSIDIAHDIPSFDFGVIKRLFDLGVLWGGYALDIPKQLENATTESGIQLNCLRVVCGGYIPSEIGFLINDKSIVAHQSEVRRIEWLSSFYENYPNNRCDYFESTADVPINDLKGLFYEADFQRRCTRWIRNESRRLPAVCFVGHFKLQLMNVRSLCESKFQLSLPVYCLNLSNGVMKLMDEVCLEDVISDFRKAMLELKKFLAKEKATQSLKEEVNMFIRNSEFLIQTSTLNSNLKENLNKCISCKVVNKGSQLMLSKACILGKHIAVIENARLVNRFGLHLLTCHPATPFKREKYFPELLEKVPIQFKGTESFPESEYVDTRYFSPREARSFRVYLENGLLVTRNGNLSKLFSCDNGNEIISFTMTGELYSSKKTKSNHIQHSSFNRGGYVLFAGNWDVQLGVVKYVKADSGHYEPSIVALQNFVYILHELGCELVKAKFFYSLRTMLINGTSLNYYNKELRQIDLNILLQETPFRISETDHLVSPAKLIVLASSDEWKSVVLGRVRENLLVQRKSNSVFFEVTEESYQSLPVSDMMLRVRFEDSKTPIPVSIPVGKIASFYNNLPRNQEELRIAYSAVIEKLSSLNFFKMYPGSVTTSSINEFSRNQVDSLKDFIQNNFSFFRLLRFGLSKDRLENEIVFKVWHINTDEQLVSRILLVSIHKSWPRNVSTHCFDRVFGNVDLAISSSYRDEHDYNITWCSHEDWAMIKSLPFSVVVQLSRYLDHGQSLNLAVLTKLFGDQCYQYFSGRVSGAHKQNLEDFYHFAKVAPNRGSMLYLHKNRCFTHLSKWKMEIIGGKKISVSKGGCLGSVIYSLQVLDDLYMSGLSIGISERIFPGELLNSKNFFMFIKSNEQKNNVTNWINSFGFGRIKLEAFLIVMNEEFRLKDIRHDSHENTRNILSNKSISHIKLLGSLVVRMYDQLYPLLQFLHGYAGRRSILCDRPKFIEREFASFWTLFDVSRQIHNTELMNIGVETFYWLNNLLFETLKDFIILHQETDDQEVLGKYGSFDMYNQYEFFFSLKPSLRDQGFKTELLTPSFEDVINKLRMFGVNLSTDIAMLNFKKFLLNRFSSAINVFALDGRSEFPEPTCLGKLESEPFSVSLELGRLLPNLTGNLFHGLVMKLSFDDSVREGIHKKFVVYYQETLRSLYHFSYNERNVDVPVKANICGTDEVGVRGLPDIRIHEFQLDSSNLPLYSINKISNPLSVSITGVSNFVQLRVDEEIQVPIPTANLLANLKKLAKSILHGLDLMAIRELYELQRFIQEDPHHTVALVNSGVAAAMFEITAAGTETNQIADLVLLRTFLGFFKIQNYKQAYQMLVEIKRNDGTSAFISMMLNNIPRFQELSRIQILYFISKYCMDSNYLSAGFPVEYLDLLRHSLNARVKTLVVRTLLRLLKLQKYHDYSFQCLVSVFEDKTVQSGGADNLDWYDELAGIIASLDLPSLKVENLILFTKYFVDKLNICRMQHAVLEALTQLALFSVVHSVLIEKSTLSSLLSLLRQDPSYVKHVLSIISHLVGSTANLNPLFVTFTQDQLLEQVFPELCELIEKHPRYSPEIFDIFTGMMDVMKKKHIESILQIAYTALRVGIPAILMALPSFFYNIRIHYKSAVSYYDDLKSTDIFEPLVKDDTIENPVIQFVCSSFGFLAFKKEFIVRVIGVVLHRIKTEDKVPNFLYMALSRFLESDSIKETFLQLEGLKILLKSIANAGYISQHCGRIINSIFRRFMYDSLDSGSLDISNLEKYHLKLLSDEDLIAGTTAMLLKFSKGAKYIANLLNSGHHVTCTLIGLAEITITDEVCKNLLASDLLRDIVATITPVFSRNALYDDEYIELAIKLTINLSSRQCLRNRLSVLISALKNFISESPEIDDEIMKDVKCLLINSDVMVPFSDDLESLDSSQLSSLFYSIQLGNLQINEFSSEQKLMLVDLIFRSLTYADDLANCWDTNVVVARPVATRGISSGSAIEELAAATLEILAKNNQFAYLLSSQETISVLKRKLISVRRIKTKSLIVDTLFWLTVNYDEICEKIQFAGMLPVLMSLLSLSGDSSDSTDLIRAILGLLVNLGFANDERVLYPSLNFFVRSLSSKTTKIVISCLELLKNFDSKQLISRLARNTAYELYGKLCTLSVSTNRGIKELSSDLLKTIFPERKYFDVYTELNAAAKIANLFGLPFLTYHPLIVYKRRKYLSELQVNLPPINSYHFGLNSESIYTSTKYLTRVEAEHYRAFVCDGLLVSNMGETLTCDGDDVMVSITLKGELYCARKTDNLQHTSFNKGGYLLFAGYWRVCCGVVKEVVAESGHYEPSLVALQNFVYVLNCSGCIDLDKAIILYTDRRLLEKHSDEINFSKNIYNFPLIDLLGEIPLSLPAEANNDSRIRFVTPRPLKLLSDSSSYYIERIKCQILKNS